ncbi:Uncharacterised protein [Flavobacterium hibernum]|nr:Uncharacterised protein [Flavobacterium hibernum]
MKIVIKYKLLRIDGKEKMCNSFSVDYNFYCIINLDIVLWKLTY